MQKIKKLHWFVLFVLLAGLCYLFPYTGDDWAWGSSIGIDRLNTWFENYSGRYFGNLIVLALTRSNLLKTIVMAGCILGIVYLITKMCNHNIHVALLTSIFIFLTTESVFRQSIVWTSGFANYATSIFLFLLYTAFIYRIFQKNSQPCNVLWAIPLFILGFLTALIVEHVTILAVAIGLSILGYNWFVNHRIEIPHILYSLGTITGTIMMFSNSVYSSIQNGEDGYRTVETSGAGLINRIMDNYFDVIGRYMFLNNIVLNIVFGIILCFVFWKLYKRIQIRYKKRISLISFELCLFSIVYGIFTRVNTVWINGCQNSKYIDGTINIIFWLALFVLFMFLFEDKYIRDKFLFILICIAFVTGPLLIVTPIGPRCFFATYILNVWLVAELFSLLSMNLTIQRAVYNFEIVSFLVSMAVLFGIFIPIYRENENRIAVVQEADQRGETEVTINKLPYERYLHVSSPAQEPWQTRFKLFYKISPEMKINVKK